MAIYTLVKVDGVWRSIDSQSLFNKSLGVKNINLSEFLLDSQGMPQVNEEFLNLAFGQNYKVNEEASPFKFYLKGGIKLWIL